MRVAQCKVPFPDALVPIRHSRTQAASPLCSSTSVVPVCIWLGAPISSCFPLLCCWVQHLSPPHRRSGRMGQNVPALHQQEWLRESQARRPRCWDTRISLPEKQPWPQPSRREAQQGRKSYCCSHTPAITSQQKAASAQPGESPRTGTAPMTFRGRAADRPKP